ncbi:MAG: UDP-GlcNAc--UDP-phosphate GlcNAc-1-phosphate transferase [Muribaculaceae bacterium]
MSKLIIYLIILIALIVIEFAYLKYARKHAIYSHPRQRSTNDVPTITGGGIIFYFAILLYVILSSLNLLPSPNFGVYLSALIGITLINAISFKDDISEVPTCIRLMIHIAGILFIASQASVFTLAWYYAIIAIICGVGFINAYNFMDGIAGMAGSYSIVVLTSIYYINANPNAIISPDLIIFTLLAAIAFCYFNFRKKELCFCGDTGSLTMGAVIFFMLATIIIATQDIRWVILVIVYGIDTTLTIIVRLIDRENIFRAHNRHIYQLLVTKWHYPHLMVSTFYALLQASITVIYIMLPAPFKWCYVATVTLLLIITYFVISNAATHKKRTFDDMKRS